MLQHVDSFQLYNIGSANGNELVALGKWDVINSSGPFANSFGTWPAPYTNASKLAQWTSSSLFLQKILSANRTTIYTGFRYYQGNPLPNNTSIYHYAAIRETTNGTSTVQVTIGFRGDGAIEVRRGTTTGTLLATFLNAWKGQSWDHWQIKCVIDPTAGEVRIRKNGDTSDTFAVTGVNTRNSANTYGNMVELGTSTTPSGNGGTLDAVVWDDQGAAPTSWIGDVRVYALQPNAETTQKDFTVGPAKLLQFTTTTTTVQSQTAGGNRLHARRFAAPATGKLTTILVPLNTGYTGKAKMALYALDAYGYPTGAPVATSDEIVAVGLGVLAFNFSSLPAVTLNTAYSAAIVTDTAIQMVGSNGTPAANWYLDDAAVTYTSGFPNGELLPAWGTGTRSGIILAWTWYVQPNNAGALAEDASDYEGSYVGSATAGATDLYDFADLPYTPSSVIGVAVRGVLRKTDAGVRSAAVRLKSGTTTSDSTTTFLGNSFQGLVTIYATDPNTGAAWTAAAVNALQAGPRVVS